MTVGEAMERAEELRPGSRVAARTRQRWLCEVDGMLREKFFRPSSADTSEPAWVKRKMLSINSSTSWCLTSRKYSAMVRPDRPTRILAPGGSFIWP